MLRTLISLLVVSAFSAQAATDLKPQTESAIKSIQPEMLEWRRHFHQYPELSNREVNTAKKVADHLKSLGLEVQTGIAHHGVLGVLKGAKPGPTVALRADMDALPVTEQVDLPYASKVRSTFNGQDVGVMHACGHDAHIASLLGTATLLQSFKNRFGGMVFQLPI